MKLDTIICGDNVEVMCGFDDCIFDTCVTSPPYYGLRDYGVDGQIGLEDSPELYVEKLVAVFREVWRVLKDDGTLWLNLGDSFASSTKGSGGPSKKQDSNAGSRYGSRKVGMGDAKEKDLIGIPWMVAFALRADGWYLRSDIIWHKPNPMPESVTDRPTKSHEYIFLLSKSPKYYYDAKAILEPANYDGRKDTRYKGSKKYDADTIARVGGERWPNKMPPIGGVKKAGGNHPTYSGNTPDVVYFEDGRPARNKRDVWTVTTKPYKEAHFATFSPDLILPCILAGAPVGGVVLDPFSGSGTTAMVARTNGRHFVGIDLNPDYCKLAEKRIAAANVPLKGLL